MSDIVSKIIRELDWEADKTRKTLSRIPEDKFEWQPHEKSKTLAELSSHISELPGWIPYVLLHSELDFASPVPFLGNSFRQKNELMAFFEKKEKEARESLSTTHPSEFEKGWVIKNGSVLLLQATKEEIIRRMCFAHIVHHRAQLGLYFRLLDLPVPAIYGPSADENSF